MTAPPLDRRAGVHALLAFVGTLAAMLVLVRINLTLPLFGHVGSALIALAFLYVPSGLARHRGEDLADYGFTLAPIGRGLRAAAGSALIVFPLFVLGYFAFYELACSSALAPLAPHGLCARYAGAAGVHAPALTPKLLEFCAVQVIVVALPEELFFRGMLLHLLGRRFGPGRPIAGVHVGWALLLTSAAFALSHLPRDGDPRALATFFPALLFGWLRLRTGSLLAPTLVHAGSNILVRVLDLMVLQ
ncbi:MAG: type II CAAX endopeptidase family protein [Kofleriaceae bacterium]